MSDDTDTKRDEKKADDELEIIDDDDDEETRLRDRLLARRAMQLREMIAAEPPEDSTESKSSASKKPHHHRHKKKKRRRSSEDIDESGSFGKTVPDRIPSVASAVSITRHHADTEEEGLTIRPPQPSMEHRRHRKRSREEHSPDFRTERQRGRYKQENHEVDRGRRDKADEGWSMWKKSLDRPYSRGTRGGIALPQHSASDRGRSPPPKNDNRYRRRSKERVSPSQRQPDRWSQKSSAAGDRASSSRYQEHPKHEKTGGRSHEREIVEKTVGSKHDRPRGEKRESPESAAAPMKSTSLTTMQSPQATPTMDEMEDVHEKTADISEGKPSKEPTRSPIETESGSSGSGEKKSRSSSMESGEHRSDDDEKSKKRPHEGGDTEVKRVKYSKFESSPSSSESEYLDDDREKTIPADQSDTDEGEEEDVENEKEQTPIPIGGTQQGVQVEMSPEPDFESSLPVYYPAIMGCRSVEEFQSLNRIEEGTYGVVYRAKEKRTDEIVALKRLKMEKEKEGFPITSLREINMLLKAGNHRNIVRVREIVVGSNMDKIYLVMDYVEHDLKSLLETMKQPFLIGEVKTLLRQLLAGVKHLHENWILHRDLKTSNLLLSHRGVLKIADFGLAREYGDPLKAYTPVVVTLWYRAPELLLGIKKYSTPIDIWSVGCIFAEILTLKPFFPGKSEIEQLGKIFKILGTPNDQIWPGYNNLQGVRLMESLTTVRYNSLRKCFGVTVTDRGIALLNRFLTYDPEKRITAAEALEHEWFKEQPLPVREDMFPTWPAKSEQSKAPRKGGASPKPPSGGKQFGQADPSDKDYMANIKKRTGVSSATAAAPGFSLKFDAPKF